MEFQLAHGWEPIPRWQQVLLEIGALTCTREDADASGELVRRVPGMFERVPSHLEQQAVGRIEDRCFER